MQGNKLVRSKIIKKTLYFAFAQIIKYFMCDKHLGLIRLKTKHENHTGKRTEIGKKMLQVIFLSSP